MCYPSPSQNVLAKGLLFIKFGYKQGAEGAMTYLPLGNQTELGVR